MRSPEICFVLPPKEPDPEPQAQLGYHSLWIERFSLQSPRLFGVRDLVLLCVLQPDTRVVIPARAQFSGKLSVDLIAQRDLEPLDRPIECFAQRCIPHIQPKGLRGVTGSDAVVAPQPVLRYGAM